MFTFGNKIFCAEKMPRDVIFTIMGALESHEKRIETTMQKCAEQDNQGGYHTCFVLLTEMVEARRWMRKNHDAAGRV